MLKKVFSLKRCYLLLLFPISLLLIWLARTVHGFADWYAFSVYYPLSWFWNRLFSAFPFSVAEILLAAAVFWFLIRTMLFIFLLIKNKKERGFRTLKWILNFLCVLGVIFFIFTLFAGINYSRTPYSEKNGLTIEPSSKEDLYDLCEYLGEELNRVSPLVKQDRNGVTVLSSSLKETAKSAAQYANRFENDEFKGQYCAPKPIFFSRMMSYTNTTGIFSPFTLEANVNTDVPDYSIPATMCHELSHLRGYMREDEANFIAYLICRQSEDPDFMYSGLMLAFVYANNALYDVDKEMGGKSFEHLSEPIQRDFTANSLYWKQFEGPVEEIASKTNDIYLKANDQEDGVKSYGRMVDLLLADFKQHHP